MNIKKRKFFDLKQRDKSFMEYVQEFNYLVQYAPEDINTDAKKQD